VLGAVYAQGRMTYLCASISVDGFDEVGTQTALERADAACSQGAQLIEWRIDHANAGRDDVRVLHLVEHSPLPCIVTCRLRSEGGQYDGTERDRLAMLEKTVRTGKARYVDVELQVLDDPAGAGLREIVRKRSGDDLPTRLIVSTHDFHGRPSDLYRRLQRMGSDESCSIAKVVWQARSLRDNLQAFEVLCNRTKPTIALCMGEFGVMSRILAPKFGGFLTFAGVDSDSITAPGQPGLDELRSIYRFDKISADTKVYGIIGWPVGHSISPHLHNSGFDAMGYDGVYVPMPIAPEYEHFKATLCAMLDDEKLDFRGASVTLPHKANLMRFARAWEDLDHSASAGEGKSWRIVIDEMVEEVGAANTLSVREDGDNRVLEITNTDVDGLVDSLCETLAIDDRAKLSELHAAIVGAGGAARAAVAGLSRYGASVTICNRTEARAQELAVDFSGRKVDGSKRERRVAAGPIEVLASLQCDVIINATSVGMTGGPDPAGSPIPLYLLEGRANREGTLIFDLVYSPRMTPLLRAARDSGFRTLGGLEMLIQQAAHQFRLWTANAAPTERWRETAGRRPEND